MSTLRGVCTNYGHCSAADHGFAQIVSSEQPFECGLCKTTLLSSPKINQRKKESGNFLSILATVLAVIAVAAGAFWYLSSTSATANSPTVVKSREVSMLRFAGSNTIGSELLPALAEAYMQQQGIAQVKRTPQTDPNEVTVESVKNPSPSTSIHISSHGSSTAFKELVARNTDIGMASRKIKSKEVSKLNFLGDMTAPSTEHVLALDGVAVIVNPDNPVKALSKEQIAAIFAGVITDWSEVKGNPGPINVYARDNNSGTFDTFKHLVMHNLELIKDARRFEDNGMLSDRVVSDPNGIGFVGLPFVKRARALAVSELGTTPLLPNRLTVATEDYPLARRLYLYTPSSNNPHVKKFIDFVLSKSGQEIVKQFGFIELNLQTAQTPLPSIASQAPNEYLRLTAHAQRLSVNFRFLSGSHKLDNKAVRDLDRVIEFVASNNASNRPVMLFGFSDSVGDESINMKLSQDRAFTVAEELLKRGIKISRVTGFGADMPVASNRTNDGRERNRRVEIWIQN